MVKVLDHPLIKVKLTKLRDKNTGHLDFADNLNQIASLMVYEILGNLKLKKFKIQTPLEETVGYEYATEIVIIGILRAGLGLIGGIHHLIPQARIGHIGLYRDEKTFEACQYFYKVPKVKNNAKIILVDPMLATGVSATKAISLLKKDGFKDITLVCLVGVNEGIKIVQKDHPEVPIYLAAKDRELNKNKYILPGLGDAGDRIFGTK